MEVIDRDTAREAGRLHYFTGQPCLHGHIDLRLVSNNNCMACGRDRAAARRAADPEAHRRAVSEYQSRNRDKKREWDRRSAAKSAERNRKKAADWYRSNLTRAKAAKSAWSKTNRPTVNAINAKRRAAKMLRTPAWFGELDEFVWAEAHDLAKLREMSTGVSWAVDHMEPLQGRTVSGLHVWNNCQVIPAAVNSGKKDKRILTEHGQWISLLP